MTQVELKSKQILSALLAIVMVIGLLPITVFATEQTANSEIANATADCEHIFDAWSDCLLCGYYCEDHDFDRTTHRCKVCKEYCEHYDYILEDYAWVNGICSLCGRDTNVLPVWDGETVAEDFASGSGEENDPYLITNGAELYFFAEAVRNGNTFEGKYIKLASDIDLNEELFPSIGSWGYEYDSESYIEPTWFAGCFDGDDHTIRGLYNRQYGLFCQVYNGTIKNLNVIGTISPEDVTSNSSDIAGIIGRAEHTTVENCSFFGQLMISDSAFYYYGGIVGEMEQGIIRNCVSDATIYVSYGYRGVGGILGGAEYNPPLIDNCTNLGNIDVYAYWAPVGGIVGKGSTVTNCQNRGAILSDSCSGNTNIAGIAATAREIVNCYNLGTVGVNPNDTIDGGYIAGIGNADAGYPGTVLNCYNAGEILFTLADGYTCNDSYDLSGSNLFVAECVGFSGCNEDSVIGYCYSLTSDYPVCFGYEQQYNPEDDWYYGDYVAVFNGQMTADDMASTAFVNELNANVTAFGSYIYTDYNGNEIEIPLNSYKNGGASPVFGVAEATLGLEIFSVAEDGTSIGQVTMAGTTNAFVAGDTVTLSAVYDGTDYRFIGWYAGNDFETSLSGSKEYSFTVTEEMVAAGTYTLTALYEKVVITDGAVEVNGQQYLTLLDAINAAESGATINLLKDYTVNEPILIDKDLTIDLGDFTITGNSNDPIFRIYSDTVDAVINVTINADNGGIKNTNYGFAIYAGKDLEGGNDAERTNITINGGTYETNGTDAIRQIMGLCTINGGTFKSDFGKTVINGERWYGSEFKINGGTFYGFNPACVSVWTGFDGKDYTNFYHRHDIIAAGKTVTYENGWYTVVDGEAFVPTVKTKSMCFPSVAVALQAIVDMDDVSNLGVLTLLADATLTEDDVALAMAVYTEPYGNKTKDYEFSFILGGYDLSLLPEGYELYNVTLEDGTKAVKIKEVILPEESDTVVTETVEVGTAEELLAAVDDGKIIVLTADITFNETLCLDFADGSILDLNGHTITLPKKGITVSGKNITVKNGTFGCAVKSGHQYTLYIAEGTTATIEGVTLKGAIYAKNGAELTLKDNDIKPWASGNASAVYAYGAKVTILSGKFAGSTQGVCKEAFGGEITIYGGSFDRKNASYKNPLANFVAEGYEVVRAVDGTYKYEVKAK